jgi:hypothetical protein
MGLPESSIHSFVIKLWLEETAEEAGRARQAWRGYITHVPSEARRYIQDLDEITDFIAPYLEQMGIRLDVRRRLRQWRKKMAK